MLFGPPSTSRVEIWWVICSDSSLFSPLLITPLDISSHPPSLPPASLYFLSSSNCSSFLSSSLLLLQSDSAFPLTLTLLFYLLPLHTHLPHPLSLTSTTCHSFLLSLHFYLLSLLPCHYPPPHSLSAHHFPLISHFPLTYNGYLHPLIFSPLCHI